MADAEKVEKVCKGLECCADPGNCDPCPYTRGLEEVGCIQDMEKDSLSVIRELKAENERLRQEKADAVSEIKREQELNTPIEPIGDYLTSEVINFNYQLGYEEGLQKAIDIINKPTI